MKKKDVGIILSFLTVPFILLWLIGGYVSGDFNPFMWDVPARTVHIIVSSILSFSFVMAYYTDKR